jgi:hypothetical protein
MAGSRIQSDPELRRLAARHLADTPGSDLVHDGDVNADVTRGEPGVDAVYRKSAAARDASR